MLSSHFFVAVAVASARASAAETFVDKWAVHVKGGKHVADAVAAEHGFRNIGQVSSTVCIVSESRDTMPWVCAGKIARCPLLLAAAEC